MKKIFLTLTLLLIPFLVANVKAQFRNMDKRIEQKVKRKLDQKADRTIDKALDKGEKEVDEEVNEAVKKDKDKGKKKEEKGADTHSAESGGNEEAGAESQKSIAAYTKFDFIPGEKIVFYDDFAQDSPGDFPVKWNANGSGEIVTSSEGTKLFELKGGSFYLPLMTAALPENYTLEFDLNTSELDNKLSSRVYFHIILDDNTTFNPGKNFARVKLPLCQYIASDIAVESRENGKELINNRLTEDIREKIKDGTHISVAVNKKRFRMWMDEQKVIDIPSLVPANIKQLKFSMEGFNEDFKNYHYYISNVKIAEGKADLRSRLLTEGRFVTSGILFDVNSDKIRPESYGVLKDIARVLQENEAIRVKVIGHTDSDGDDKSNLELSKRRAISVKSMLAKDFGIAENRFETDGKGESQPSGPNSSPEEKANNRRVEFVKL